MTKKILAFLVLVLVAASACSQKRDDTKKSIETDSNRTEASVVIRVRGTQTYDFSGRTTIIIFRTLDERVPLEFRLFSVGVPDPGIKLADGGFFRAAFDVLGFEGDGSYTIGPTILGASPSANGLQVPSGIQSNAFVQWLRPAAALPLIRYDVALEACRVNARSRTLTGTLSCPRLRDSTGTKTLSLEMTWDAR